MSIPIAKTIKVLLKDGSIDGVLSFSSSGWNGEINCAPVNCINHLLETVNIKSNGVYLLISSKHVFIGCLNCFNQNKKILKQEKWNKIFIISSSGDLSNKDVIFLRNRLVSSANRCGTLYLDANYENVELDDFRIAELIAFSEEALLLLELFGVSAFTYNNINETIQAENECNITNTDPLISSKSEAVFFLNRKGVAISKNVNYATLQKKKMEYWVNPHVDMLIKDWTLLFNDPFERVLTVIRIPANTFGLRNTNRNGFVVRNDRKHQIDMSVFPETLIDSRSRINLTKYVDRIINY